MAVACFYSFCDEKKFNGSLIGIDLRLTAYHLGIVYHCVQCIKLHLKLVKGEGNTETPYIGFSIQHNNAYVNTVCVCVCGGGGVYLHMDVWVCSHVCAHGCICCCCFCFLFVVGDGLFFVFLLFFVWGCVWLYEYSLSWEESKIYY